MTWNGLPGLEHLACLMYADPLIGSDMLVPLALHAGPIDRDVHRRGRSKTDFDR